MTIGGSWDDTPHDAATVDRARAAVHAALDAGITDFDHADIYAHGKSEAVFGELLAEDPALARAPGLARAVAEVEASSESGFMEKA